MGPTHAPLKEVRTHNDASTVDRVVATLCVTENAVRPGRTTRNGFYERDFVTRLGTLRLRIARTRQRAFLSTGLGRLQWRAAEVLLLIREAVLAGPEHAGRGTGGGPGERGGGQCADGRAADPGLGSGRGPVSHRAAREHVAIPFLDGVSRRVRRPSGRQRVQLVVAYGCGGMAPGSS